LLDRLIDLLDRARPLLDRLLDRARPLHDLPGPRG
jgi:hypothetical protein